MSDLNSATSSKQALRRQPYCGTGIIPVRAGNADLDQQARKRTSIRCCAGSSSSRRVRRVAAQTKKFTETTGVKVRLDAESWDDIRRKAAVAANVGLAGLILGTLDDPFQIPEKLIDMTEQKGAAGLSRRKYGAGIRSRKSTARRTGLGSRPQGPPALPDYRISHIKAAGFDTMPTDLPGFLKLCQGLKKKRHAGRLCAGTCHRRCQRWCQWLLWARRASPAIRSRPRSSRSPPCRHAPHNSHCTTRWHRRWHVPAQKPAGVPFFFKPWHSFRKARQIGRHVSKPAAYVADPIFSKPPVPPAHAIQVLSFLPYFSRPDTRPPYWRRDNRRLRSYRSASRGI